MSILANKKIDTDGEYVNLAEALGIDFVSGNQYQMQVIGPFYYQTNSTKPTIDGFSRDDKKAFAYTASNEILWVKTTGAIFVVGQ